MVTVRFHVHPSLRPTSDRELLSRLCNDTKAAHADKNFHQYWTQLPPCFSDTHLPSTPSHAATIASRVIFPTISSAS